LATGRVERRLAAILAADVAGYSRLMGADEEESGDSSISFVYKKGRPIDSSISFVYKKGRPIGGRR
jgi:hypothetical protein